MPLRTIPVAPNPHQTFSAVLRDRDVDITLRVLEGTLYVDVVCEGVPICAGRICTDRLDLVPRAAQLGFPGLSLCFADLRGTTDPDWTLLGSRYLLLSVELDAVETAAFVSGQVVMDDFVYDGSLFYDGSQSFDGTD
jgi:hypothetical protein